MMRKARSKADKAELKQLIEKNKQRIKHMWEKKCRNKRERKSRQKKPKVKRE